MRKSNVALRLQTSLLEEARRVANSEGVALNQLINVAVAEKLSALRTEDYFCERSSRANLDCSLFKEQQITERYRVQIRGEFFNAFNHPQFDLPNATIGSAAAGVISSTVGSPRDIQLSLRLMF